MAQYSSQQPNTFLICLRPNNQLRIHHFRFQVLGEVFKCNEEAPKENQTLKEPSHSTAQPKPATVEIPRQTPAQKAVSDNSAFAARPSQGFAPPTYPESSASVGQSLESKLRQSPIGPYHHMRIS